MDIKVPESKVNLSSSQIEALSIRKPGNGSTATPADRPFGKFRLKPKARPKKYPPLEPEETVDLEEVMVDEFEKLLLGE